MEIYRNLMVKRLQKWIKSEINIRSGNVRSDQLRLSQVKFCSDELDPINKDKVMPSWAVKLCWVQIAELSQVELSSYVEFRKSFRGAVVIWQSILTQKQFKKSNMGQNDHIIISNDNINQTDNIYHTFIKSMLKWVKLTTQSDNNMKTCVSSYLVKLINYDKSMLNL